MNDLSVLEELHHSTNFPTTQLFNLLRVVLDVYIWLGHKFEGSFADVDHALAFKERICLIIEEILDKMDLKI